MGRRELQKSKDKLAAIKNETETIREAFAIFSAEFPKYNKDTIVSMIADESGKCKASVYSKLSGTEVKKTSITTF